MNEADESEDHINGEEDALPHEIMAEFITL